MSYGRWNFLFSAFDFSVTKLLSERQGIGSGVRDLRTEEKVWN